MNGDGVEGTDPHACAACQLQRKRCDESCELACYFPASRYNEFLNAYELFGLSNIVSTIKSVQPHQRQIAAESLLFHGNARKRDPVLGCVGIMRQLQYHIRLCEAEISDVMQQLNFFKKNQQQQQQQQLDNSIPSSSSTPQPPPLQLLLDDLGSLGLNPTEQITDLNQDSNEITSVHSDTQGEQQSGKPDEEANKDGDPHKLIEEIKD